jgi:hypothetical protein
MQSTGVLNLVIGLTSVKENRGAHLSYVSYARSRFLSSSVSPGSSQLEPPPPIHAAAAYSTRRPPAYRQAAAAAPCTPARSRAPPVPPLDHAARARRSRRRSRSARALLCRLCASAIHEARASPPQCASTSCHPRSRASTPQPHLLRAHQVFEVLPDRHGT